MPRELVCTAPKTLAFREYQEPPLMEGEVRVKSRFTAAKHGTEMAAYKGYGAERGQFDPDLKMFLKSGDGKAEPRAHVLGNMTVGEVVELGAGVSDLKTGDTVLFYGGFRETHVKRICQVGGFTGCWKVPPGVSWKSAVCIDPADFAVGAVRDGQVRLGDAVAIFGMGAIGLVCIAAAKLSGAHPVIAVDLLPIRREAAKKLGADLVLDPSACDTALEIKKTTGKRGADVCIEYSGARQALQDCIRGVAPGGRVVCGAYPPPYGAGLDLGGEAHHHAIDMIFTRACTEPNREHPRWNNLRIYEVCWRLICDGKIDGEAIVTPVVPFDELLGEYPKIETEPAGNIKLAAKYA